MTYARELHLIDDVASWEELENAVEEADRDTQRSVRGTARSRTRNQRAWIERPATVVVGLVETWERAGHPAAELPTEKERSGPLH